MVDDKILILRCCYLGLEYHGFQIQPSVPTIQSEIKRALEEMGYRFTIYYSSRTDSKVSALDQIIALKTDRRSIAYDLNKHLPEDIRIHAYTMSDKPIKNLVISKEYLYVAPKFNIDENIFRGIIDYINKKIKLNYYYLIKKRANIDFKEAQMTLRIQYNLDSRFIYLKTIGKKFYWEQVRRLVNLILSTALGIIRLNTAIEILNGKPYKSGIPPAPPEGLILSKTRTKIDHEFVEVLEKQVLEKRLLSKVKKAILATRWVFPPHEK